MTIQGLQSYMRNYDFYWRTSQKNPSFYYSNFCSSDYYNPFGHDYFSLTPHQHHYDFYFPDRYNFAKYSYQSYNTCLYNYSPYLFDNSSKRFNATCNYSEYMKYSLNAAYNSNNHSQYNLVSYTPSTATAKSQNTAAQSSGAVDYGTTDIPAGISIDLAWWKAQGYDEEKGNELSLNAYNKPHQGITGECVGYTRKTINEVYGTKFTNAGAAERFGYTILSSPELQAKGGHFKKFRINGIKPSQVPDGAILIWPHTAYENKPGTKAALYGHGGIAHNGKVYSNCVCQNLSKCCEIWIPVKA